MLPIFTEITHRLRIVVGKNLTGYYQRFKYSLIFYTVFFPVFNRRWIRLYMNLSQNTLGGMFATQIPMDVPLRSRLLDFWDRFMYECTQRREVRRVVHHTPGVPFFTPRSLSLLVNRAVYTKFSNPTPGLDVMAIAAHHNQSHFLFIFLRAFV